MGQVTLDKPNYMTVVHSAGFYEDDNNVVYPFSVEKIETEDETSYSTIWDDDIPENQEDVESEILREIFAIEEE